MTLSPPATVTTPTTVGTTPSTDLHAKVLPPPAGYQVATETGAPNGPITSAMFDDQIGQQGAAASFKIRQRLRPGLRQRR
jgi:hypothetical protein